MSKKVILACEVCSTRNYSTLKSSDPSERLQVNKFCKICNSHTSHLETK